MFDSYAEVFAGRARAYHSAMRASPHVRDAEFYAVLAPIADAPDGLVCDIPAGGCYLAHYLRSGMRYVGVEPVEQFADTDVGPVGIVLNAPIDQVPLPDASVDHVISLAGLHHEQPLSPVLEEMRRLVRRGGRVVIADAAVDTGPARFLNGFVARNNPLGHDGHFLDGATRGFVEAAGLRVIDDAMIEVPWIFDSVDHTQTFCAELFGIVGVRRHEISDALASDIGFDDEGGQVRLRWALRRIVCEAA